MLSRKQCQWMLSSGFGDLKKIFLNLHAKNNLHEYLTFYLFTVELVLCGWDPVIRVSLQQFCLDRAMLLKVSIAEAGLFAANKILLMTGIHVSKLKIEEMRTILKTKLNFLV